MGSDAQVIVNGPEGQPGRAGGLAAEARRRVDALEACWSRFLDGSELSGLNRRAGHPVEVSEDLWALVVRAIDGWRVSGGRFDPTVHDALLAAGYDRDLDDVRAGPRPSARPSRPSRGCAGIALVPGTRIVALPRGVALDPGGIGKGLAADLVVADLLAAGAAGACVNLGGDLRVEGEPPGGGSWAVEVEDPWTGEPVAELAVARGAVATTSRTRRVWETGGGLRHHLIDPATGRSAEGGLAAVTVLAGEAWRAEVLAKAAFVAGEAAAARVLAPYADGALLFRNAGGLVPVGAIEGFLR